MRKEGGQIILWRRHARAQAGRITKSLTFYESLTWYLYLTFFFFFLTPFPPYPFVLLNSSFAFPPSSWYGFYEYINNILYNSLPPDPPPPSARKKENISTYSSVIRPQTCHASVNDIHFRFYNERVCACACVQYVCKEYQTSTPKTSTFFFFYVNLFIFFAIFVVYAFYAMRVR